MKYECKYKYCHCSEDTPLIRYDKDWYHEECMHEKNTKLLIRNMCAQNMPKAPYSYIMKIIQKLLIQDNLSIDYILFVTNKMFEGKKQYWSMSALDKMTRWESIQKEYQKFCKEQKVDTKADLSSQIPLYDVKLPEIKIPKEEHWWD